MTCFWVGVLFTAEQLTHCDLLKVSPQHRVCKIKIKVEYKEREMKKKVFCIFKVSITIYCTAQKLGLSLDLTRNHITAMGPGGFRPSYPRHVT